MIIIIMIITNSNDDECLKARYSITAIRSMARIARGSKQRYLLLDIVVAAHYFMC